MYNNIASLLLIIPVCPDSVLFAVRGRTIHSSTFLSSPSHASPFRNFIRYISPILVVHLIVSFIIRADFQPRTSITAFVFLRSQLLSYSFFTVNFSCSAQQCRSAYLPVGIYIHSSVTRHFRYNFPVFPPAVGPYSVRITSNSIIGHHHWL